MKRGKLNKNISLIIVISVVLLTAVAMYALFKPSKELTKQELLDMIEQGELATTTYSTGGSGDILSCSANHITWTTSPFLYHIITGMQKIKNVCPPCFGEEVEVYEVTFPNPLMGDNFYITACDEPENGSDDYGSDAYACYEADFADLRPEATVCHQCDDIGITIANGSDTVTEVVFAVDIKQRTNPTDSDFWALDFQSACNDNPHCPINEDCPGDTDGNGIVNIDDQTNVIDHWLEQPCPAKEGCCGGADLNGDGIVNMADFALVTGNPGFCTS